MTGALHVAVVGRHPWTAGTVRAALEHLAEGSGRTVVSGPGTPAAAGPDVLADRRCRLVLDRSRRYLDLAAPDDRIVLSTATTPEDLDLAGPGTLALLVLDADGSAPVPGRAVADLVSRCRAVLPGDVVFDPSPTTVLAYHRPPDGPLVTDSRFSVRYPVDERWLLAADVVATLTDSVQRFAAARFTERSGTLALGTALVRFLNAEAGAAWGLHSYTGSVVARTIETAERHAVAHGNPVLRGPSEHSLACGALARWQLDRAPFLMIVTSGMADEFRGTLANLRDARARGLILCAESSPRSWLPFQGTVHAGEDIRAVLTARGLRWVHLDDPAALADGMDRIARAWAEDAGPVVVLAGRSVLDATGDVPLPARPEPGPARVVAEDALRPLADLLNDEPVRVLAQVGYSDAEQAALTHDVARRAGVALADSLTLPGTVCGYRGGRPVEEYLGTLSLYGYSPRVHAFLHSHGGLRPRAEQALLFLNSAVPEIATPFSPRVLRQQLRVLQTVPDERYRAPFADVAVVGDQAGLLRALRERLDVRPDVRELRHAAIRADADVVDDVLGELPLQPMSPNYFFRRLGDLLRELIEQDGYTYTGVFDVGRGGLAAVCKLPRTGPGLSGWYGRALMGDALQSVPAVALTRPGNVLAFVGDGAAALVPDVLPSLVQQLVVEEVPLGGNLTVFRLVNGAHSVIRTYRETYRAGDVGAQTSVLSLRDEDLEWQAGPVRFARRWIDRFDPSELGKQLTTPGTVNQFSVLLGHNNEGDGLAAMSAQGWQRAELGRLSRSAATGRRGTT